MSDRRVRLAVVTVPYAAVIAAIVVGWVPVWCLGVVFAAPLAVRLVRTSQRPAGASVSAEAAAFAEAAELAAVFLSQLLLGFIIRTIIR